MSKDPDADLRRVARDLISEIIREDLHRWAQLGVAIGDLIFIISDGNWPGIPEGPQVVRFDLIRPLCQARIGKGLRNMEVKEFCAPRPATVLRTAFLSKDGPEQLFYTDVAKLLPVGAVVAHA